MYFSWATDLDPKGVNSQIKEAMLSPGQGEDESLVTQSGKNENSMCYMKKKKKIYIYTRKCSLIR